jgi:hypothetical protein
MSQVLHNLISGHKPLATTCVFTLTGIFITLALQAQTADGNNGLNQANTLVRSYFESGTNLLYGVGALVGLLGAFRVYDTYHSSHREDAARVAAKWFGSCIFILIAPIILKAFFGL